MTHDVIIIGGGVSGLATGHALMMRGQDVQVLERQKTAGGNAISERFNGFLMEHGPSTFNASLPDAVAHIDALGLLNNAQDLGPNVKRRYLRDQGKLTGISTHPLGFFLSGYLSPKARFALMLEGLRSRNKSKAEETIHAFVTRRFGREFADKVIDPLAAGLFMGDAQKLSINGAFARLVDMENTHGSITRAILKAKKGSAPGRHLYSWDGGIGTIPQLLSDRLGNRVHTGVTVLKLIKTSNGFEVQTTAGTRRTRAVVLATQPHVAAGLLEYIDPDAADAAGEITAPPVNVVYFGYKREQVGHPLDGLGYLGTKDTSRIVSGAQFCSTMYTGRAPDGYVSISAYAGGARNPDLAKISEAELVAQVHTELADLLNIKGDPVLHKTRRWALGLPQYTLGHPARVENLETTCDRVPGMFVTGNYLQGISVANCLNSAAQTAERVGATLAGQSSLLRSIPTGQKGFGVCA